MADMQLDYGDTPMLHETATASKQAHEGGGAAATAASDMPLNSSTAASSMPNIAITGANAKQQSATDAAAAGAASRILDELLGDMLTILEDSEEEDEDENNEDHRSLSSSSSDSSSDIEDTLQVPPKAISPIPSEKEEGELESEDEVRLREERRLQARIRAQKEEARRLAREERKKRSIENNISERDVFKYLKNRGFPTKLLHDFTQACISPNSMNRTMNAVGSTSGTSGPTRAASEGAPSKTPDNVPPPSKEDLRKLSNKHSYKQLIRKSEKAKESKEAIGRLLDTCTAIVAEQEALSAAANAAAKEKEKERERRAIVPEKVTVKGNYTGRKCGVDKGVQTDAVQSPPTTNSISRQAQLEKDTHPSQSNRSTRLPTPTSPTRNGMNADTDLRTATHSNSQNANAIERAARAAKLASQFEHVLKSKQLNFSQRDLERFNVRPPPPASTSATGTAKFGMPSASRLPDGPRAPLHPALNGVGGLTTSSSSSEPVLQPASKEARREHDGMQRGGHSASFKPVSTSITQSTSSRPTGSTATSRIIQGASSGTTASYNNTVSSTSKSNTGANATSTDSASSSSAAQVRSIYDLVPDDILFKKTSPHAYTSSLPSDGSSTLQSDGSKGPAPSNGTAAPDTSARHQTLRNTTDSLSSAADLRGKGKENQSARASADVAMWFGSEDRQDGAYSPLEMDSGAPPPLRPQIPTTGASAPRYGNRDEQPPYARAVRTSMSPPPPNRGRQGSATSPPPSATSSLPPPPSHLPARPSASLELPPSSISTSSSGPIPLPFKPANKADSLKALFPKSFHKQTALPKKPHSYNEVTSTNEAVPIVQKQIKSLDPRMVAAERMKMLREKERDSENSDKERAASPPAPPITSKGASGSAINATEESRASGPVDATMLKGPRESSASPDSLFEGPEDPEDAVDMDIDYPPPPPAEGRPPSPPIPDEAQRAANAKLPLPSFKKVGQTSVTDTNSARKNLEKDVLPESADDEKQRRELELKNRLKRAREDNAGASSPASGNKRQARVASSTVEDVPPAAEKDNQAIDKGKDVPLSEDTDKEVAATSSAKEKPTSARRLVNSAGRRMSEAHKQHDIEDSDDEDEAVQVVSSRMSKPSSPKNKTKLVPVVEVRIPSSRQGSIASTISAREGSVDSRVSTSVAKPKSVVARKSTGGLKLKPPTSSAMAPPNAKDQNMVSSSAAQTEGMKVTLKLGGIKTPKDRSASAPDKKVNAAVVSNSEPRPSSSQTSRTVIEIDDSSDDTDEDEPATTLRKSRLAAKKHTGPFSSAPSVSTPPSSTTKSRPRARPIAGSGKKFLDDGVTLSPAGMQTSSIDSNVPPLADRSQPEDTWANQTHNSITEMDSSQKIESPQREQMSPATSAKKDATASAASQAVSSVGGAKPVTPRLPTQKAHSPAVISSPPMIARDSASPAVDGDMPEDVIPDSESEAYSPSRIPRYSPSPIPNDEPDLPDSLQILATSDSAEKSLTQSLATSAIPGSMTESENTMDVPMPMTQVASSQSPEDSQMLRSASDTGGAFDDEVDMLASDTEDNAFAGELLKDTLDDLPDLPTTSVTADKAGTPDVVTTSEKVTAVTTSAEATNMHSQSVTVSKTIAKEFEETNMPVSNQGFMDPMDLSQAFGEEEAEESDNEHDEIKDLDEIETQPLIDWKFQSRAETEMHKATSPKTIVSSLDDGLEPSPTTMEQSSTKSPSLIMPIDLADARSNVQTGQHRRATAVDFMETRLSPPSFASRERTSYPNAPSHPGDGDHHHTPAQNVGVADSTTSTIVSPTVLPSENESFEIVMEQASPVKSFNAKATNASAEVQRSRAVLEALDKPLEEPFTKCRWGTGCLDLDCKFAHPSPALQSRWGSSGDLPRTRTECSDGVRCPNTACTLSHPSPAARRREVCANQANCPFGAKCIFRHVDESSLQLTKRYQSHNQSARFNTSDSTTIQPSISARQQASPPPQIVSGSTTIHAGGSVSTSTLPFLSHHPMPPIPAGTPPLSRSASPAVTASSNALRAPNAYSSASGVAHPHLSSNQQPQQQGKPATQMNAHIAQENQARPQSVNRTWTNLRPAEAVSSTAGWLANLAGLGK